MVLFSTKFVVSSELTQDIFIRMLSEWIASSKHYEISVDYQNEPEYEVATEDKSEVLRIYRDENRIAVQLSKTDDSSVFTNTYVLKVVDERSVMFVELTKEVLQPTMQKDSTIRIPKLMKEIFWQEYGGMDNDIFTDDKSLIIRRNNLNIAKGIVQNTKSYLNPIVYISPILATGKYITNYERLASDLLGIAHVVVEGSPFISDLIGKETENANPSDGSIGIYFPSGEKQIFKSSKSSDIGRNIVSYVREAMASVVQGEEFSFYHIRYEHLLDKLNAISGDDELAKLYDEVITEKDARINELTRDLDNTKKDLLNANAHVTSLQTALESSSGDKCVSLNVTESDLYVGEMKDVVLKVLRKEYQSIKDDSRTSKSRKVTVLRDILENNQLTGKDEEIRKSFRDSIKSGTLNAEQLSDVERLGFVVAMEGKKHYKITFNNDSRYQMSFSSTPSDSQHAGENLASSYMNMLFGY